jgi:hypothetical protein
VPRKTDQLPSGPIARRGSHRDRRFRRQSDELAVRLAAHVRRDPIAQPRGAARQAARIALRAMVSELR